MGSSFAPVMTSFYMETFWHKVLDHWFRYVDDTFMV